MSERLDVFLTLRGDVKSRERAKQLIKNGFVSVNGKECRKPAMSINVSDEVVCSDDGMCFVGRGGLKLDFACKAFQLDLYDMVCADIGASTGGFTQCMLEHGAKLVYAIDVGHGQLDESLCSDPNVINCEGVNARELTPEFFGRKLDFISGDLSFISLKLVTHALTECLKSGGDMVLLIKPQFEAGKQALNKKGIVKNQKDHIRVITELVQFFQLSGLTAKDLIASPVQGGDGNVEYLIYLNKSEPTVDFLNRFDVKSFVSDSFSRFKC